MIAQTLRVGTHLEAPRPCPGHRLHRDHLVVELSRQVEYLVADVFGPDTVGPFLSRLKADLDDQPTDDRDLNIRNYVLFHLAALLGPGDVPDFCATYLNPDRFEGLPMRRS